jgi:hypothetical protein
MFRLIRTVHLLYVTIVFSFVYRLKSELNCFVRFEYLQKVQ